jgi:hypothetical protein
MCLNCGCGQHDERHGNEANIVADDVRRAGEANGQDLATTIRNLEAALATISRPQVASAGEMPSGGRTVAGRSSDH